MNKITREIIKDNLDVLYIFGDNVTHSGMGGMAKEFRGEPNTLGIPTKWAPAMHEYNFFTDDRYLQVCKIILNALDTADFRMNQHDYNTLYIPVGIGTGLAEMDKRAPNIYNLMLEGFRYLATRHTVIVG